MKIRILAVVLVLLTGVYGSAQTSGVDGQWEGIKNTPERVVYTAEVTLQSGANCKSCTATGEGSIQGKIVWCLRSAGARPIPALTGKAGKLGTEYVRGQMRGKGLLVLNGYKLDDPNHILMLDKYRMAVSDDGKVLGGLTMNGGLWTGQFIVIRPQH